MVTSRHHPSSPWASGPTVLVLAVFWLEFHKLSSCFCLIPNSLVLTSSVALCLLLYFCSLSQYKSEWLFFSLFQREVFPVLCQGMRQKGALCSCGPWHAASPPASSSDAGRLLFPSNTATGPLEPLYTGTPLTHCSCSLVRTSHGEVGSQKPPLVFPLLQSVEVIQGYGVYDRGFFHVSGKQLILKVCC